MIVNIFLVLFNMLPAFPMDGGRVLRALLATRMGWVRGTQVAAKVGQAMAAMFAIIGLMVNPFLVLIAAFVWMGATQEAAMAGAESVLAGATVDRVAVREVYAVHQDDLSPKWRSSVSSRRNAITRAR
ncbi:MAG: site-2 protease family protein [Bryobacterales bacterium]